MVSPTCASVIVICLNPMRSCDPSHRPYLINRAFLSVTDPSACRIVSRGKACQAPPTEFLNMRIAPREKRWTMLRQRSVSLI